MNPSSNPPRAISTFKTPKMNAMSPPCRTGNHQSDIGVPNTALPAVLGTQYRRMPGSMYGFTKATCVPCSRASSRYFVETGWSFAGFDPQNTTRSVPYQSE